jgi:23S rRNA (uracil1939-C5)-methyltransferase
MTAIFEAAITNLSHDGRGIARLNGKTTFIADALPGEIVQFRYQKKRARFDEGSVVTCLQASPERVAPGCIHYERCGGCQLQHMSVRLQQQFKQTAFLEQLKALAGLSPEEVLPPLTGPEWAYRRRARLSVKYVQKKQRVLIGFREKNGRYITDTQICPILAPPFNTLIPALQDLVQQLLCRHAIPQIELAGGDTQAAMIFRHTQGLSTADQQRLRDFAKTHQIRLYLQPDNLESIYQLWPQDKDQPLDYTLFIRDMPVSVAFEPWDFIQVNAVMNQKMVEQAAKLLALQAKDHVLELFCGIGNFSLALAKQCQQLTGVEGCSTLIQRAIANATRNQITNINFHIADLSKPLTPAAWWQQRYTHLLIDPPRSGALEILPYIPTWNPLKILYVSCNPATLCRDAYILAKQGYQLKKAGLLDMFPHTKHSEWMCLFNR